MTWAKLDDRFHAHPKTMRVWRTNPRALGLLVLALSWSAAYEQDGYVPDEMFAGWEPDGGECNKAISVLVEAGFLHRNGDGYDIHDFLDFNPSRAELAEQREGQRERQRAHRERQRGHRGRDT